MREILARPNELRGKLNGMKEERERLWTICQSATVRYGNSRVSGGTFDREALLAELADFDAKMERRRAELAEAEEQAEALLRGLADIPERTAFRDAELAFRDVELLRLRYLRGLTWDRVRQEMKRLGYSAGTYRTLYNWHVSALRRLESQ